MKKILIIVLAFLCLNATAQIQTKFWGLELSSLYYESLETLKDKILDKCQYAIVDGDAIGAINGKFGGYYWDFVRFKFSMSRYGKVFYQAYFVSSHDTHIVAANKYDGILATLMEKYGQPSKNQNGEVLWFDENGRYACTLKLGGSGEEKSWSIYLMYADTSVLQEELEKEEDEL